MKEKSGSIGLVKRNTNKKGVHMIQVKNLSLKYQKANKYSLSKVSFEIADGEIVGLIGKNGAGKSTLMKSICKFITPSEGEIFMDNKNIWRM